MEPKNKILKEAHDKLFKHSTNNYIFIYTPPKVGSTTLMTSFRISMGKTYNILHIHDEVMMSVLTNIHNITIMDLIQFIANQKKQVFVIDVYRTPIERKMSEFFEKIGVLHFNNTYENVAKYSIKKTTDRFNYVFPYLGQGDHYFDKYLIDEPCAFDFDKKYTIQEINNVKFIKLRLCDSSEWGSILSKIMYTKVVIIVDYQTIDKTIGDLYNKFKKEYKIPSNFLSLISNCKYFNFYYSASERHNYLKSWESKISSEFTHYTPDEYTFYMKISLENQYYDMIQLNHYIDNGCFCKCCIKKRRDIYFKALNGTYANEKIIHEESVNEHNAQISKKTEDMIHVINAINKKHKITNNQTQQMKMRTK